MLTFFQSKTINQITKLNQTKLWFVEKTKQFVTAVSFLQLNPTNQCRELITHIGPARILLLVAELSKFIVYFLKLLDKTRDYSVLLSLERI